MRIYVAIESGWLPSTHRSMRALGTYADREKAIERCVDRIDDKMHDDPMFGVQLAHGLNGGDGMEACKVASAEDRRVAAMRTLRDVGSITVSTDIAVCGFDVVETNV